MILADTSIWIDHFRNTNAALARLLSSNQVCIHPWITGELACGNLSERQRTLRFLHHLPQATVLRNHEILVFLERNRFWGKGVRFVDMHLLASAAIGGQKLWTKDRRLHELAVQLGRHAEVGADGFVR